MDYKSLKKELENKKYFSSSRTEEKADSKYKLIKSRLMFF